MPSARDIQRRIKSVSSTKKITKAMEMVAAAKMRRSVESVLKTRTYANLSWATVLNLSRGANGNGKSLHPLLSRRTRIRKVGIVLFAANRGLCGGFNANIIAKARESVEKHRQGQEGDEGGVAHEFIVIGKKGLAVRRHYGYPVAAEFPKADIASEVSEVLPISRLVLGDYLSGRYDKIMVAYTDFVSAIKQVPRVKQLLPVDISTQDEYLGIVGEDSRLKTDKSLLAAKEDKYLKSDAYAYEYIFEPSPGEVLDEMIPRLIEIQLFQALLESNASEHSARMAAMRQATDAAKDMVDELTLFYNKARQASITAEIAEISAGANALARAS